MQPRPPVRLENGAPTRRIYKPIPHYLVRHALAAIGSAQRQCLNGGQSLFSGTVNLRA